MFETKFEYVGNYMAHNVSFFSHNADAYFFYITPIFSQERYVLFLYPFISIFVVKGVFHTIELIWRTLTGTRLKFTKYSTLIVTYIVLFFSIVNLWYFYQGSIRYKQDVVLQQLGPLHSAGLALRKHRNSLLNSVVIYDYCESQVGSSIITFSVLSGILTLYTKVCGNGGIWVKGHPRWVLYRHEGYPRSYNDLLRCSIDELSAINEQMNFKFDRAHVDYEFIALIPPIKKRLDRRD